MTKDEKTEFLAAFSSLVDGLRKKAADRTALDPLQDMAFNVAIEDTAAPDDPAGVSVRVTAISLSGGGVESSYVKNDSVSFLLSAGGLSRIEFLTESGCEEREAVPPGAKNLTGFLESVGEFFERIFS